jgi:hypothetical protein
MIFSVLTSLEDNEHCCDMRGFELARNKFVTNDLCNRVLHFQFKPVDKHKDFVIHDNEFISNKINSSETFYHMDIDVWVERTLQPGSYNTFALPFGMTLADFKTKIGDSDVKVKELTDATLNGKTLTLTFGDATEIAACTPYLVKLSGSESVTLGAFDEVYMTSPVEPQTVSKGGLIDFVATLGLTTPSADKGNILFVGANNTLLHPSDNGQKIKGFRAYFELKGEAQNAQSFGIDLNEGGETGISSIENGELKIENESWHTIDGKRINGKPTQKGVYIMNGKKTVL